MELTHRFALPASVEQAWTAFYFPNRIAPCFPGATLGRVDGDYFDGVLKIKLGPMPVEYEGAATFLERSPEDQRIVVEAHGEDRRGRGAITARVAMTFTQTASGTDVEVVSDVTLTGQATSFSNTVLQEASDRLVQRLVGCVSGKFTSGLGDPPTAEELAMAKPAKPAGRPAATTNQMTPAVPDQAPLVEPDHDIEVLNSEPDQDHEADTVTTEPDQDHEAETLTTEPDQDHEAETLTTEPDQDHEAGTLTTEPDQDHEADTVTTEPAEADAELAPAPTGSAAAADTGGTPEPSRSAPLSDTSEAPSKSVVTLGVPLLRRYRAPMLAAIVLGAAIGIVRRIRR